MVSAADTVDQLIGARAARVRRILDLPILVAALAVVPVIYIEQRSSSPSLVSIARAANWAIWSLFLLEYVAVLGFARNRWQFAKKAWLDAIVIVVSFPLLSELLATTRLLRLARLARVLRLLRLGRLAAVLSRAGIVTRRVFKRRGLGYVAMLTLLLALGLGVAFALVEERSLIDGIWWSVVTLTTVGYGDVFPVTQAGRLVAAVLMILGIGFVAFITATVAATFVDSDDDSQLAGELRRINGRLQAIEEELRRVAGRPDELPAHTSE
jgi:voltage-gated potassium channel